MLIYLCLPACLATADPPARQEFPVEEVRQVVAAVVEAAEENAKRPRGRLSGDALGDHHVRRAARAALEKRLSVRALLLGLGVALDDSSLLRKNPMTRSYLAQVETDAERTRRLRSIGSPTLRKRHDWLLHFWISAAVTAHAGPETAERVGIAKELMDAQGGSGFSFGDLAADFAGVALARQMLRDEISGERLVRDLAESFRGEQFLPPVEDLEEGLKMEQFLEKYGGVKDPRFLRACDSLRARLDKAPGLRPPTPPKRDK